MLPILRHHRLDPAALQAVRGDRLLDRLLERDDQVRQRHGRQVEPFVPRDLGPTQVDGETAGDGEPADAPGAGRVQRVEQPGQIGPEERDRVVAGDAAGEVDDVGDPVPLAQGEEGLAVGGVEGLHRDLAGQERGDVGPAMGSDDDLLAEVEQ